MLPSWYLGRYDLLHDLLPVYTFSLLPETHLTNERSELSHVAFRNAFWFAWIFFCVEWNRTKGENATSTWYLLRFPLWFKYQLIYWLRPEKINYRIENTFTFLISTASACTIEHKMSVANISILCFRNFYEEFACLSLFSCVFPFMFQRHVK